MEEIQIKRRIIEFDTTGQYFGLGISWSAYRGYRKQEKFIAFIIGCLVIRFNLFS